MDEKERARRIREIKSQIRAELRNDGGDPSRLGDAIAILGANLRDVADCREPYAPYAFGKAARGSATCKIRKALGYTYP